MLALQVFGCIIKNTKRLDRSGGLFVTVNLTEVT